MAVTIFPTPSNAGPTPKTQTTVVIKSTQSWTAPVGVTSVEVILCGGGGGGGVNGSGGGGGGGSVFYDVLTVTPGTSYTITIGAGGASQTAGTASSFGALLTATGGATAGTSNFGGQGTGLGGGGGANDLGGRHTIGAPGGYGYGGGGGANVGGNWSSAGSNGGGGGAYRAAANANTGSGGSGVYNTPAGAGGSGICIIKYWA